MQVQIFSDLHLELATVLPVFPQLAPILILAGDIGCLTSEIYQRFIYDCCSRWTLVIYVMGNHEYHYVPELGHIKSMSKIREAYRQFFTGFANLVLLDNNKLVLGDYVFVGTTLWSDIPRDADLRRRLAVRHSDVRHIHMAERQIEKTGTRYTVMRPLNYDDIAILHQTARQFLRKTIAAHSRQKVIVISHHAPYTEGTSAPQYELPNHEVHCLYASDCRDLMASNVPAWIFGHTHWSAELYVEGTRLLSNQMGYDGEATGFSGTGLVTLE